MCSTERVGGCDETLLIYTRYTARIDLNYDYEKLIFISRENGGLAWAAPQTRKGVPHSTATPPTTRAHTHTHTTPKQTLYIAMPKIKHGYNAAIDTGWYSGADRRSPNYIDATPYYLPQNFQSFLRRKWPIPRYIHILRPAEVFTCYL